MIIRKDNTYSQSFYKKPYDHTEWVPDHVERVNKTINFLLPHLPMGTLPVIADFACGAGTIPLKISRFYNTQVVYLYDICLSDSLKNKDDESKPKIEVKEADIYYSSGYHGRRHGEVDLTVCTEIIEHLDSPEFVLSNLCSFSKYVLITTPFCEPIEENPEHLWIWDTAGVMSLFPKNCIPKALKVHTCAGAPTAYQYWLLERTK